MGKAVRYPVPFVSATNAFMNLTIGRALIWVLAAMSSLPDAAAAFDTAMSKYITPRNSVPWVAHHGMTSASYQDTFDQLVNDKYHLTYVSGYSYNNDPRFAAIWEQSPTADWVARHGMTSDEYQQQFNLLVSKGFRLILVNGYTISGDARFAAIWDKSAGAAWVARHGMTSQQYQAAFNDYTSQGYRLQHVSGYAQGNSDYYAAIWSKSGTNVPWVARHGMTSEQYQNYFNEYTGEGFRPLVVCGYVVNNVAYYAAIWEKSASGPWVARHGMSSTDYQNEFNNWVGAGYRLTVVSGYTLNSNQDTYAAIWYKQ